MGRTAAWGTLHAAANLSLQHHAVIYVAAGFGAPTISIASACGNASPQSVKKTTARRMTANPVMAFPLSCCKPTAFEAAGPSG
jgi:hypothetical protein